MNKLLQVILLVVLPLAWGLGVEAAFAMLRAGLARRKEARRQP